jgi:DNA-binding MarR family transcriptional regulator
MMLDSETTALAPREDHVEEHDDELRLLLRLLSSTTVIEGILRTRLREKFDVTSARFDLMAQLDRLPNGMNLSDISEKMMVSNGNVTGLVDRLVETGHIDRRTSIYDGRVKVIRLTKVGRAEFRKMATAHKKWVAEIFSDLEAKDVRELMRLLDKTKISARNAVVR